MWLCNSWKRDFGFSKKIIGDFDDYRFNGAEEAEAKIQMVDEWMESEEVKTGVENHNIVAGRLLVWREVIILKIGEDI